MVTRQHSFGSSLGGGPIGTCRANRSGQLRAVSWQLAARLAQRARPCRDPHRPPRTVWGSAMPPWSAKPTCTTSLVGGRGFGWDGAGWVGVGELTGIGVGRGLRGVQGRGEGYIGLLVRWAERGSRNTCVLCIAWRVVVVHGRRGACQTQFKGGEVGWGPGVRRSRGWGTCLRSALGALSGLLCLLPHLTRPCCRRACRTPDTHCHVCVAGCSARGAARRGGR